MYTNNAGNVQTPKMGGEATGNQPQQFTFNQQLPSTPVGVKQYDLMSPPRGQHRRYLTSPDGSLFPAATSLRPNTADTYTHTTPNRTAGLATRTPNTAGNGGKHRRTPSDPFTQGRPGTGDDTGNLSRSYSPPNRYFDAPGGGGGREHLGGSSVKPNPNLFNVSNSAGYNLEGVGGGNVNTRNGPPPTAMNCLSPPAHQTIGSGAPLATQTPTRYEINQRTRPARCGSIPGVGVVAVPEPPPNRGSIGSGGGGLRLQQLQQQNNGGGQIRGATGGGSGGSKPSTPQAAGGVASAKACGYGTPARTPQQQQQQTQPKEQVGYTC